MGFVYSVIKEITKHFFVNETDYEMENVVDDVYGSDHDIWFY